MHKLCSRLKIFLFLLGTVLMAATGSGIAVAAQSPYSLRLDIRDPDILMPYTETDGAVIHPEEGCVLVFGTLDHPGFYLEDINRLTVKSPTGSRLELIVDQSSIIREFGAMVALKFAFNLSVPDTGYVASGYRVLWGEGIEADNRMVERLIIDGNRPEQYRQFYWEEQLAGDDATDTPFSTITVIADSTAEYHFLWYLLPMGLIFGILTIRKIHARHSSD